MPVNAVNRIPPAHSRTSTRRVAEDRRAGAPALGAQHTAFGGALAAQLDRLRHQGVLCESIDAVELADCVRLSFFGFLVDTQFTFESGQSRMRLLGKLLGAALAARVSVTDSATGSR